MKKLMFYPLWTIEKLEERLRDFELNGWRLSRIKYSCVFYFEKSKPRNSDYILTYDMAKDNARGMYDYECMLLTNYSANIIRSEYTGFNIFRITASNRDFADLKNYRKGYFKHVLFQYMLISSYFVVIGIGMLLAAKLQSVSRSVFLFASVYTSISIMIFVYRLYGYVKQTLKGRNQM